MDVRISVDRYFSGCNRFVACGGRDEDLPAGDKWFIFFLSMKPRPVAVDGDLGKEDGWEEESL